jgi:hypothetical protein
MATAFYASDYYRAVDVEEYITDSSEVKVSKTGDGYFFDGPGTEDALIFYPGGKVDETAYAPILNSLAEKGVDCFLISMPLRLAVFGQNKADDILSEYGYSHYYLAGHSLGGVMASSYCAKHTRELSGLFLLAAYPSVTLNDADFPIVYIYGTNDKVLDIGKVEESFSLVPSDYSKTVIEGGNHAQFGSYGAQDGDGTATITTEEQWQITVNTILKAVNG